MSRSLGEDPLTPLEAENLDKLRRKAGLEKRALYERVKKALTSVGRHQNRIMTFESFCRLITTDGKRVRIHLGMKHALATAFGANLRVFNKFLEIGDIEMIFPSPLEHTKGEMDTDEMFRVSKVVPVPKLLEPEQEESARRVFRLEEARKALISVFFDSEKESKKSRERMVILRADNELEDAQFREQKRVELAAVIESREQELIAEAKRLQEIRKKLLD